MKAAMQHDGTLPTLFVGLCLGCLSFFWGILTGNSVWVSVVVYPLISGLLTGLTALLVKIWLEEPMRRLKQRYSDWRARRALPEQD